MKKAIMMILFTLLMVSSVMAANDKPATVPGEIYINSASNKVLLQATIPAAQAIESPGVPSTDDSGECIPWEIKDAYCNGDVRHYTQCQKTVSGGIWQSRSEICTDTPGAECVGGKCVRQDVRVKVFLVGFTVLGILLMIFRYYWNKGGRK